MTEPLYPFQSQAIMKTIILVCGIQGSGKSWLCRQLTNQYHYVPHDRCWKHPLAEPEDKIDADWGPPGSVSTHFETLINEAMKTNLPVLTEVPFGERALRDKLIAWNYNVVPVFVIEDPLVLMRRYSSRDWKPLPVGALTRAAGLPLRASEWNCFAGTSDEVLEHLIKESFDEEGQHPLQSKIQAHACVGA